MNPPPPETDEGQSVLVRGCLLSGVVTVLVIVALKIAAVRIPFFWTLILAAALWMIFFVVTVRRAGRK